MARARKEFTTKELVNWLNLLIARDKLHTFYCCKPWLHLRQQVLQHQHYECQRCRTKGRYEPATVVHHKQTVRKRPDLALTESNCEALCDQCHYEEHHKHKPHWNDERW